MHPLSRRATAACMVAGLIFVGACGSSDGPPAAATAATTAGNATVAPEDIKVDDATVAAGLAKMPSTIAEAIAAIGTADAKAKLDAIEALWASFEGTVRDKESALYLQIEDQLTPLQRQISGGDKATATATAATMAGLFTQYLAKHPG